MTFDDQTDPYDPELAERFAVLDRLTPPPAPTTGGAPLPARTDTDSPLPSTVEVLPTRVVGADRWRRTALVGAAAAVVVVAGLAAFTFGGGDGETGPGLVEAGPAAGTDEVDGSTDASIEATTTDDEGDGSDRFDGSSSEAITVEVPTEDGGSDSSGGADDGEAGSTTTSSVPSTTATSETTATTATTAADDGGDDGDPGDSDELIPKNTTIPERPTGSIVNPGDGQLVTVTGIVDEVFSDCEAWLVLNENGEAEHQPGVSCDGGSFIVVGGNRIQTSSGFVAAEMAFDKHPDALQPGKFVTVTAINGPYGVLTLDCDRCGIGR